MDRRRPYGPLLALEMRSEQEAQLLEVHGLKKYFPMGRDTVFRRTGVLLRAVDGVSLSVNKHETFALVGESGSGKTTTGRLILGAAQPTAGKVIFKGKDLFALGGRERKNLCISIQAVFQDPSSSLDPRIRVGATVAEPLVVNRKRLSGSEIRGHVRQLLHQVGLDPTIEKLYPHELSGGMLQRVAIARALALNPELIVLDEPLSSLDVSIQAQVANLLKDIQVEFGLAFLLIAHNLATVRYMSHRVGVMYLGKLVEVAPTEELFTSPLHPYTQGLIEASLPSHPRHRRASTPIVGEIPSPLHPPPGCAFHPRCRQADAICSLDEPRLTMKGQDHWIACYFY